MAIEEPVENLCHPVSRLLLERLAPFSEQLAIGERGPAGWNQPEEQRLERDAGG